jgi:hypothetical protein
LPLPRYRLVMSVIVVATSVDTAEAGAATQQYWCEESEPRKVVDDATMNDRAERIDASAESPSVMGADLPERGRLRAVTVSILVVCIIVGVGVRERGLATPLTGTRDTHTASITRNLMRDGPKGLFRPRVNYPGNEPGFIALEFPLLNAAQALTARAAPWAGEAAFRVPSLLAFVVGLTAVWDLARRRLGVRAACFAAILMTFFPVQITTSVSPGPDQAAVSLAVLGVALLDRYLDSNRLATLTGATGALAAAALVKQPMLVTGLPCLVLMVTRRGWRSILKPRIMIAAGAVVAPVVAWMIHSRHVNASSRLGWATAAELVDFYLGQRGRVGFYLDPGWYRSVGDNLIIGFTAAGVIAAVLGLTVAIRRRGGFMPVLFAWLAALAFYVFFLPFHLATHKYYVLPFAPPAALLGGLLLAVLSGQASRLRSFAGWLAALALVVGVVSSVPGSMQTLRAFSRCRVVFGDVAQKHSAEDQLIVTAAPGMRPYDGILLYRADRRGWKLTLQPSRRPGKGSWHPHSGPRHDADDWSSHWTRRSVEQLETMRRQGASLIGILGKKHRLEKIAPGFMEYLEAHYPEVARNRCCVFFDLSARR